MATADGIDPYWSFGDTTASNVILADPWWNPALEGWINFETFLIRSAAMLTFPSDQAIDRAHRVGFLITTFKLLIYS